MDAFMRRLAHAFLLASLVCLAAPAPAQLLETKSRRGLGPDGLKSIADTASAFVNFETPQVKPIAVARVGTGAAAHSWLLACNTPDHSLEVYDAQAPYGFVARVPCGLGPVTVRWNATLGKAFVCNFVGDSVSVIRLDPMPGSVRAVLERTTHVGDEPSDITFVDGGGTAVVTLSAAGAITVRNTSDLSVSSFDKLLLATVNPVPGATLPLVVRQPRVIQALPDGRSYVLNFMGDVEVQSHGPERAYDLDLLAVVPPLPTGSAPVGRMGSTNHSFAIDSSGSKMFVVGTLARHLTRSGVVDVRGIDTGFVQSWMWVVDLPTTQAPSVAAEAPGATVPAPVMPSINLNRDYATSPTGEVGFAEALSQPTDVVLLESGAAVQKVFVAAFHSDRIGVLTPDAGTAGGWAISRIDVPVLDPAGGYGASGPRGLAISPDVADPATPGTPGLVYSLNRLDNTVCVINPHTESIIAHFPLRHDPTPRRIRVGRPFLYSARHSGSGFVSCASCHVDGRTDGLPWDLGGVAAGPAVAPFLHDGDGFDSITMPVFPSEKGPMVTQTLQGLKNGVVNREAQPLFSSAPYHWRGDKPRIADFNEAFVNLQGAPNIGSPSDPRGLTQVQAEQMEAFIDTIVHEPNPEQDIHRIHTGTLGANPNDPLQASGLLLGMQVFHTVPGVNNRACAQCHHLPEGSSNTLTMAFQVAKSITGGPPELHAFETPRLRGVAAREMVSHLDATEFPVAIKGSSGILHKGDPDFINSFSINTFVRLFEIFLSGPTPADVATQIQALTRFIRQFDTGQAPLVGRAYTIDPANPATNTAMFDLLEGQVLEANIGLAVHVRRPSGCRGYWFDASVSPPIYRDDTSGAPTTRTAIEALAAIPGSTVVLQGTALGEERRIASVTGVPTPISDPANPPARIRLEPMAPMTAWVDVTRFTGNLPLSPSPATSLWTFRTLQDAVIGPDLGVSGVRHEPSRRFRVTGDHIRPGARLILGMPAAPQPATFPILPIVMELYPTGHRAGGRIIWETAHEAGPIVTLALLNGGVFAPGVGATLLRQTTLPPLQPKTWNRYLVAVQNEDGTISQDFTWQTLRVQDGR